MGWGAEVDSRDHGISAGARPPAPARRHTGHSRHLCPPRCTLFVGPRRQGVRLSAGAPGAASRRSVLSPRPAAGSRGLEGWTGCRSRGGEHSPPPPRAVEEVTGEPLTSQKPARLSGMGVVEGRVMGWGSGVDSRTTKSRRGHGRRLQHGAGAQPTHCPSSTGLRGLGVRVGQGDGLQARWAGTRKQVERRGHGRRLQHGAGTQLPHHPVLNARSSDGGEGEHRRHQDRGPAARSCRLGQPRPK